MRLIDADVMHREIDKFDLEGRMSLKNIKRYIDECDSYLEKNRLLNSKGLLFYQVRNIPDRTRNHGPRKADAPLHEVKSSQGSLLNQMLRRMCLEYSLPIITAHKIRKWAFTYRFNLECDDKYCKATKEY